MLRREFIEKGTSAEQLAQRLELAEVQLEMDVTQQSQRLAQARLETIQRQLAAGVATKLDMMRAELDAQERELELRQLALRLRQLRATRPQ
jgi:outer membrane protein TolC